MINLEYQAPIFDTSGYAEAARNYIFALANKDIDIRIQTSSYSNLKVALPNKQTKLLKRFIKKGPFISPYIKIIHETPTMFRRGREKYCIGYTTHESEKLPAHWVQKCNIMDEIWVPSTFNKDVFLANGVCVPVRVIPHCLDFDLFNPSVSPITIANAKTFKFLSIFQWIPRKGYPNLIKAYCQEFSAKEDVCLILKTFKHTNSRKEEECIVDEIQEIKDMINLKEFPQMLLYTRFIDNTLLPNFIQTCNSFVLPSYGEGFCLPIAESMALNKPIITLNHGGYLDYVDRNFLIPRVPDDEEIIANLRKAMRSVFNTPDVKVNNKTLKRFTYENIGNEIYQRLLKL